MATSNFGNIPLVLRLGRSTTVTTSYKAIFIFLSREKDMASHRFKNRCTIQAYNCCGNQTKN